MWIWIWRMEVSPSAKKVKKSMDLEDGQGVKSPTAILAISISDYTIVAADSSVTVDYSYRKKPDEEPEQFIRIIELSPSYMLCQTGPMEQFDLIRKQFPYGDFRDWIVGKTTDQVVAHVAKLIDNKILTPLRVDLMPWGDQLECAFVGTTNTTHGVYNIEIPQDKKATKHNRISYDWHKSESGCWTNGSARSYLEEYMSENPLSEHLGSHYALETYGKNCMEYGIKKDKVNCGGNIRMICFKRGRHGEVKRYSSEFENMNTKDDPNYKLVSRQMKIIKCD